MKPHAKPRQPAPQILRLSKVDCDRALSWRHEATVGQVVLLHGSDGTARQHEAASPETYAAPRKEQEPSVADARQSRDRQIAAQPVAAEAIAHNGLRAVHHTSTNRAVVYPHDDDEAALLDAIDAGDCDADGSVIPYPRYRGA